MNKEKGQITTITALITAGGMIIAAAFTGWFSAGGRIGTVETKISVVEERENNHYSEVQKQLKKMDEKLDTLLGIKNQSFSTPPKKIP